MKRPMSVYMGVIGSMASWICALSGGSDGAIFWNKPLLDVIYEPTSYTLVQEMLEMAGVTSDDLVYDLGSGDGRIVIMAAKQKGATAVGVDLDPDRIRESLKNAESEGVAGKVRFFEQNLF